MLCWKGAVFNRQDVGGESVDGSALRCQWSAVRGQRLLVRAPVDEVANPLPLLDFLLLTFC
jgi:hypothetical protein